MCNWPARRWHWRENPGRCWICHQGAGRFWPLLAEKPDREIIGADYSQAMLDLAGIAQPAEVVKRVRRLQASAFDIDLPDNTVDSIFACACCTT